jgi:hypothetical protein
MTYEDKIGYRPLCAKCFKAYMAMNIDCKQIWREVSYDEYMVYQVYKPGWLVGWLVGYTERLDRTKDTFSSSIRAGFPIYPSPPS